MVLDLKDVSIDYPLDSEDGYSLKNFLVNFAPRGQRPKLRTFRALDRVSLTIAQGERVGLIGLNGAGKTTLLRVMSGIFQPSEGAIGIHGRVSPLLDFSTGFEEHHSGIENIRIRLMFLGEKRDSIERLIPQIAEFSELGSFLEQPVRTYSTGMAMRLAFATSTAIDPEILIADEVIGAGDLQFAEKARQRMESFLSRDRTTVLSSHSLDLVRRFCSRVIWLHRGRVMADGPTDAVIKEYETKAPSIGS
jgi:ABC-type polysaccharide/polyol phosphate transport system ATPase subunit